MATLKSVLRSLLAGDEESGIVIIRDSVQCSGRALLKYIACQWTERFKDVHVLVTEMGVASWLEALPGTAASRLTLHDLVSSLHQPDFSLPSLPAATLGHSSCVVIDSLSTLLLHFPATAVCRWLISSHTPSVALLHSDLHSTDVLAQLQYVVTSEIDISPAHKTRPFYHSAITHTVHRRTSGKVIKQTEQCDISRDYVTMDTTQHARDDSARAPVSSSGDDPTANLTFDLRLSEAEKEARSQVVLPYTSQQHRQYDEQGLEEREGDEDDELDFDSDPDDDLDI